MALEPADAKPLRKVSQQHRVHIAFNQNANANHNLVIVHNDGSTLNDLKGFTHIPISWRDHPLDT